MFSIKLIIKRKLSIRWCSIKTKHDDKLINKQVIFPAYKPKLIEKKDLFKIKSDGFNLNNGRFSMIFPPPNVTGKCHLGHALTSTIQDVIARWERKKGAETLWIFGLDHAGIATQVVVEKMLFKQQGKTRHDIGKDAFLKEVWKWKNENGSAIKADLKRLATTFNWDKEYFTMDPALSSSVNEAFIRLFDKGLIYRDNSLINWSCSLESAISDVEVESLEINGKTEISVPNYEKKITVGVLTNFAYKVANSNEEVIVSTTRPETMLGDVAVAVHPNDSRYSHLRNTQLYHPYRREFIPLIFDESVDPNFGTGAVKITPAHDKNDFDIGKRHNLQSIQVFTENGLICANFEKFGGLKRFDARQKILDDLSNLQLFRGSKPHNMILPICSRSKDIIEFMIKSQWFVKCDEMSMRAVEAVKSGKLKINPPIFEKEWFRWLENCRDWCISRQLWWGHEIPAYKFQHHNENNKNEEWIAAKNMQEAEIKFKQKYPNAVDYSITKDSDVLDTWFSSGLLPISVFNWPNVNDDFKNYFPLNVLETGHDILFFWVARMVMLSLELTGEIPFKEILLHGIVCDSNGRKMSKSLGNVILPEQIINGATLEELHKETRSSVEKGIINKSELEKSLEEQRKMFPNGIQECGIDALRFTLCSQNAKQHFINFDINDCVTNKLFFNKIWQATKYAVNFAENKKLKIKDMKNLDNLQLSQMDLWILSRLGNTIQTINEAMKDNNLHLATAALKTFFYANLCDIYLETTKEVLHKSGDEGVTSAHVLNLCLSMGLNYMEIFTPYLVEELKQFLPVNINFDIRKFIDNNLEKQIDEILEVCASIREIKAQLKVTKKSKAEIKILIKSNDHQDLIRGSLNHIKLLTFSPIVELTVNSTEFEKENFTATSTASHLCSFGINFSNKSDNFHELNETVNKKKLVKLEKELESIYNIVSKEGYREKANKTVQQKHDDKIKKLQLEIVNIKQL